MGIVEPMQRHPRQQHRVLPLTVYEGSGGEFDPRRYRVAVLQG